MKYNLGGSTSLINKPNFYESKKVKVVCIDSFIKENNFDFKIDFIKIDAEGAEPNIISGMSHCINFFKPIIVCEVLFGDIITSLEKEFLKYNYKFYFHYNHKLILVDSIHELYNFKDVRNCFFVPDEKLNLIEKWIL